MIKNIFSSQNIGNMIYYFVEWAKEGRKPSWITAQACPQIIDFLQKHGSSLQIKIKPQQNKKEIEKSRSLPGEITQGQPIFGYLKWRSQQKMTDQKEQLGDLEKRIQSEGTPRYNQLMIQRLEAKKKQLNEQYMQERPTNRHLDFMVDKVQGVQKSRFKKLCFVITIIGRATRYVVPMKIMKKHFPLTLRDYIIDLIQVHHAKDIEEQQALLQKQAQQGAGIPKQAPMPIVTQSNSLSLTKISRISEIVAEKPKFIGQRPSNAIMEQEQYSHNEDSIYSGASQSFE